jgi:formylglycine-generating enzyme
MKNRITQFSFGIISFIAFIFLTGYTEPATPNEVAEEVISNLNANMVLVQGGRFTMGCTSEQGNDCYDKAHTITVNSFSIDRYLVTQGLWKAVMGNNPSDYFRGCDSCPIETVNWNDVQVFIGRLNALTGQKYRLPTETEWEYAARGGNKSSGFKYAGGGNIDSVAWYAGNSGNRPHPVGQKQANELGLYDMAGNVYEWCADWYGVYNTNDGTPATNPNSDQARVLRGGSWRNDAPHCRIAYRNSDDPDDRFTFGGLRLVRD